MDVRLVSIVSKNKIFFVCSLARFCARACAAGSDRIASSSLYLVPEGHPKIVET